MKKIMFIKILFVLFCSHLFNIFYIVKWINKKPILLLLSIFMLYIYLLPFNLKATNEMKLFVRLLNMHL